MVRKCTSPLCRSLYSTLPNLIHIIIYIRYFFFGILGAAIEIYQHRIMQILKHRMIANEDSGAPPKNKWCPQSQKIWSQKSKLWHLIRYRYGLISFKTFIQCGGGLFSRRFFRYVGDIRNGFIITILRFIIRFDYGRFRFRILHTINQSIANNEKYDMMCTFGSRDSPF